MNFALCTGCSDPPQWGEEYATPRFEAATLRTMFAVTSSPAPVPVDGEWETAAGDHAATRYSGLAQIDASNVASLRLAWTFSGGNEFGQESSPLVVGGRMYLVTPFPHRLYALDLASPGSPPLWRYEPPAQRSAPGVACCGRSPRGLAHADGRLFFVTLDDQVVAVDAATGAEAWRVRVGDINRGETMTMAPLVVKGRVLVGNSGADFGVRGWIAALDAVTGNTLWKAYSTGPDAEVLIGPSFRPFYAKDRGSDLGVTTWAPGAWRQGGGNVSGWLSYDPALDLVYHGTARAAPLNPELRPGDNKWAGSVFARDPDTGEARWAYQLAPNDPQGYDATGESVLLELAVDGAPRRVLARAERNGLLYLLDRATGEVLAADSFASTNAVRGVDRATGLPSLDPTRRLRQGAVVRDVCPSLAGAKGTQPMAWSPRTRLLYVPAANLCMDAEATEANYIAGTPYLGANLAWFVGPGGHRGELLAWDPVRRRKAWSIREPFPVQSGVLATAGELVFYGTMDRWLRAVDARTGRLLWRFRTGAGITAPPITFLAPDGKQYVAVFDGPSGRLGAVVDNDLSSADPTAAGGAVGAVGDLPRHTERGGTLYVFGLP